MAHDWKNLKREDIKEIIYSEIKKWKRCRNAYTFFTVKQLKDGNYTNNLIDFDDDGSHSGRRDWSCVYCFFNEKEQLQYIGETYCDVRKRLREHLKPRDLPGIKDNWIILVVYARLWVYTHKWMERHLLEQYTSENGKRPPLNKKG